MEGIAIDPPGYKKYKSIFLDLNRRSTIYGIEEIPRLDRYGNAMSIPPNMRHYKRTKINDGTDINAPVIYVTQEISGWSYIGNDYSHRKVAGEYNVFEIIFDQNSNFVRNPDIYKEVADNLSRTGGVIQLQAATTLPAGSTPGGAIDGVKDNFYTMEEILDARANTMYEDLIDAGVPKDKIMIMEALYDQDSTSTKIKIAQPPQVPGINENQIKD